MIDPMFAFGDKADIDYIRFLKLLSAKGVTTRDVSRFQTGHEPTRTLCRRTVRKRVRHNITLRLSL